MAIQEYLEVTLTEAETIEVEFVEEDLITVNFTTTDILKDRSWVIQTINNSLIFNEVPTSLTVKRFQTANSFATGTLQVYLNGIKEKNITIHSNLEFSLPIDSIVGDKIEVSYIIQ